MKRNIYKEIEKLCSSNGVTFTPFEEGYNLSSNDYTILEIIIQSIKYYYGAYYHTKVHYSEKYSEYFSYIQI